MKRFKKNKFLVLVVSVALLSVVYIFVQKAIDNYNFGTNKEIEIASENENSGKNTAENVSEIQDEELNLVLEEREESGNDESADVNSEEDESVDGNKEQNMKDKILIHITGEVNNPGVVTLDEGSRIIDAINAAGGATSNADTSKVNLVYILEDGIKVNIPSKNDAKEEENIEYVTQNSGDKSSKTEKEEYKKKYSVVNINTATQTELETLPGVGPSLALKIINYRKENGKFSVIEDIKNVSGIGEKKYEDLKKYIKI